ncbi:hypothetical protein Mal4_44730 [Maioricimonas rarisocia]|uniref:Thiopeptide-type bacteriocin biosynthesis domain protein n=1 Tax=Maioricimonas rarisocia TaxID=2528026 RepID=A0A517ZCA8_9PLAN|nr:lantibiotic dehydratase [Maioricimonas rarisocia]QDU40118.1 hypothetical protein Mal4_44730 [Maioricimonas rarisocia]
MNRPSVTAIPDFVALRAPLLPFDAFMQWGNDLQAAGAVSHPPSSRVAGAGPPGNPDEVAHSSSSASAATKSHLTSALAADRAALRSQLSRILEDPHASEALFVASPSMYERLETWRQDPESKQGRKAERSLTRYFARMTGRGTPFGLFASCGSGTIADQTCLPAPTMQNCSRRTRLDMEYLFQLAEELATVSELRTELRFFRNNTIYRAGGRLRYAESHLIGQSRSHRLVVVDETDYLVATLDHAADGARIADLAAPLVDDDISLDEAEAYVHQLIDSQLLVSELQPPITTYDPLGHLIDRLRPYPVAQDIVSRLEQVRNDLRQLDSSTEPNPPATYTAIADQLRQLPAPVQLSRLFQVDSIQESGDLTLGEEVADEILRGVEIARSMYRRMLDDLTDFRNEFLERYGDREVPLMEALDEESGIGFRKSPLPNVEAEPLLGGVILPMGMEADMTWTHQHTKLLGLYSKVIAEGKTVLELSDHDIAELKGKPDELPDAFTVKCSIAASSQEDINAGDYQILFGGAAGPSGARLLGRFAYADEDMNHFVQQHLRQEEALQPEAIFAEIVHLPEDRMGNVLCRPVLRNYEIPYLGQSGAPRDRQIEVTDLMVSIRNGRILLRSRRLNKEVIPRLTSAHNFLFRTLGVYQFLGALQHQGVEGWTAWNWGPIKYAPFLPRVTAGRTVLCRATWNLNARDVVDLQDRTAEDLFAYIQQWRSERRLPRYVLLVDRDNELPIDMENILSLETFIDAIKGKPEAQLVEMLPGPDALCVESDAGRHVHELVVPFHREREPDANRIPPVPAAEITVRQSHPPGSDWAWLNLFAGTTTVDRLLVDEIRPRIAGWSAGGQIDRWFFLRYDVPGWHLRLRLHGDPGALHQSVVPELNRLSAELIQRGLISRAQWDTYEPEANRYGGPEALPLAEQIFTADSDAALDLIATYGGDAGSEFRWKVVLLGLDRLLDDLGFDLNQKLIIARHSAEEFAREFSFEGPFRKQLSQKHREVGPELDRLLRGQRNDEPEIAPAVQIFANRASRVAGPVRQLQQLEQQERLVAPLAEIARSLWHMQVNRVLRTAHRAQELVLYDLIARQYESQLARLRPKPPKKKKARKQANA